MIIDDLDFVSSIAPAKNDAPLIVDADRMAAGQFSFKRLQSIARRHSQIAQPRGGIQILQFALRDASELAGEPSRDSTMAIEEQIFGQLAPECNDHTTTLSDYDNIVK
jgi:hypothetical protein